MNFPASPIISAKFYLRQSTLKIFFLPQPFSKFRLHQRKKRPWGFNLSLLPQSMGSDSRVHNHWFLIVQCQKVGALLAVVSDEDVWNWNSKPSNSLFLYFHTLLIPWQDLTFLNLFKLIFTLSLAFSYSIEFRVQLN